MAKVWNLGSGEGEELGPKTVKRRNSEGKLVDHVRVPPFHSGCVCSPSGANGKLSWDGTCKCGNEQYFEHTPGQVYLSLTVPGQFFAVPRGKWVDVPGVSLQAIQAMCPHLVSEDQAEEIRQQDQVALPVSDAKPEKQKKAVAQPQSS